MKKSTLFFIILLVAIIETTILDYFKVFNVKPDLLLLGVIALSFYPNAIKPRLLSCGWRSGRGIPPHQEPQGLTWAGLHSEGKWTVFFAILAGCFKDLLGINTFGINTFLFPLWVILLSELSKKISLEYNLVRIAIVFLITILNGIASRLILLSLGKFIPLGIFLRIILLQSVYTTAVSALLFKFIK